MMRYIQGTRSAFTNGDSMEGFVDGKAQASHVGKLAKELDHITSTTVKLLRALLAFRQIYELT